MKANAPERIYLQKYDYDTLLCLNKWNIHEEWTVKPCNEKIATNIEYIRTDAFIEKVINFLNYKLDDIVAIQNPDSIIPQHIVKPELIEDFKKYIEEYNV